MPNFFPFSMGSGDRQDDSIPVKFTISELKASAKNFGNDNFIGRGGFGCVYYGIIQGRPERNINGQKVAIKVSRNNDRSKEIQWQAEKDYLSRMKHKNIIKLIGYCETQDKFYLVYPFMKNGNVKDKIPALDWSQTLKIIKGAASAIEHLHSHAPPLIYRDLKPENILLDKDDTVKLADFGTVTKEGEYSALGSDGYTDPIIMNNEATGSKPNDIYSLGVVILQLIMKKDKVSVAGTGVEMHVRHWASNSYSERDHAVHEKLRSRCSRNAARAITKLGLECVSQNTAERPTIREVLERLENL